MLDMRVAFKNFTNSFCFVAQLPQAGTLWKCERL